MVCSSAVEIARDRTAHLLSAGITAFALTFAAPAVAAPTDEADALFEEGRRLMDEGKLPDACAKLERSFQLAPRLGTMLNLGACTERRGQLARAIALYERAATLARQTGRADREAVAREYAAALEAKVGKLVVVLEEPAADQLTQIDGETISTRGGLVPLDPGRRRLVARAAGRAPFEKVIDVTVGATITVKIPRLAALPPAEDAPRASSTRTWVVASGVALTVVGASVGTYFGLRARSKHDAYTAQCDARGCTPDGLTLSEDARTAGNVSTVAFAVSGAALAGTIVALVLLPGPHAQPARVTARVVPSLGGLSLAGSF